MFVAFLINKMKYAGRGFECTVCESNFRSGKLTIKDEGRVNITRKLRPLNTNIISLPEFTDILFLHLSRYSSPPRTFESKNAAAREQEFLLSSLFGAVKRENGEDGSFDDPYMI
jgi:hypothetical protein